MTYAKVSETGSILEFGLSETELKARFPHTSFTVPFSPPEGYVEVATSVPPSVDGRYNVEESLPILENGQYKQQWNVVAVAGEELAVRELAQKDDVRRERNFFLAASDWTQLADAPVDSASWAIYRQSLRDVTTQQGFPWEVVWPEVPA